MSGSAPRQPGSGGGWLAVAVLGGGLFMAVVSTTVVSVALPSIGRDLHAGPTELEWVVDTYVLVYASLLVAGGVMGDRRGRKGLFMVGVTVFGLGALVTGLAQNVAVLLAGRVMQGLGPALLVPGSLTIIRAIFEDPRRRAVAIGLWSTSSGLALAVGPALGGLLVDRLSWRYVFLFNVPLGVVLLVLAAVFVPRVPRGPVRGRFDWLGAILTTAAVAAITFALVEGRSRGWTSPWIITTANGGALALTALVAWELLRERPLVDVRLFRQRTFTIANLAALVVFFSFVGSIVYFSAYFQQVQGRSAITAGLDVSAIGVAFAVTAQLSGRLIARAGARLPALLGLSLSGAATLGLLRLQPGTPIQAIWWNFALVGAGTGLCLTPMTQLAMSSVDADRAGMASAVHNALRQVGQVLGVAVLGALVYARLPDGPQARFTPQQQTAFVHGLHNAIWVSGLALLAAGLLATLLPKPGRDPAAEGGTPADTPENGHGLPRSAGEPAGSPFAGPGTHRERSPAPHPARRPGQRPRIAVFAGPTATILNSPPLLTSNKARAQHDLPPLTGPDGAPTRFDQLRPQRIAAPVVVYVEAYSAHPLEADAAHLYAPPDGWLDAAGLLHRSEPADGGTPVHIVELRPEDGLYPLPYMARQGDGQAWDGPGTGPWAPAHETRQTFYPDAHRLYEEIDRFGLGGDGRPMTLSAIADFDFYRAVPSGGYTKGLAERARTDKGAGEIPIERLGMDYFGYAPAHLAREPDLAALANATNLVQSVLRTGWYTGLQWLEGSPTIEETMYWLGLLIDSAVPMVGHSAQRPHQALSNDGERNIVDGARYLVSGAALDQDGRDRVGPVVIADELVYAAREITKVDARPGGYETAGGHGGVVADLGGLGPPRLTYVPGYLHTCRSDLCLTRLPGTVIGVTGSLQTGVRPVEITTKNPGGGLVPTAMPVVTITKYSRYGEHLTGPETSADPSGEVEILSRITANLASAPLAGFVAEGNAPFGTVNPTTQAALRAAAFAGMPTVTVGRGNTGGTAYRKDAIFIAGSNLTATKARMLLMAALLRFGALPPAADPFRPTQAEIDATSRAILRYQQIFDTH